MNDERTIGRTQPQYPSGFDWVIIVILAAFVGLLCAVMLVALWVVSIDPAKGMGI